MITGIYKRLTDLIKKETKLQQFSFFARKTWLKLLFLSTSKKKKNYTKKY